MYDYINDELKKRYANLSFTLTIILQFFCYRYIKYNELILIFSTLMFFTCFLIITESVDLIAKKINVFLNIKELLFAVSSILLFISICLITFGKVENEVLVLIILLISFVIYLMESMGKMR